MNYSAVTTCRGTSARRSSGRVLNDQYRSLVGRRRREREPLEVSGSHRAGSCRRVRTSEWYGGRRRRGHPDRAGLFSDASVRKSIGWAARGCDDDREVEEDIRDDLGLAEAVRDLPGIGERQHLTTYVVRSPLALVRDT
jgi:hypothetical protein